MIKKIFLFYFFKFFNFFQKETSKNCNSWKRFNFKDLCLFVYSKIKLKLLRLSFNDILLIENLITKKENNLTLYYSLKKYNG